ncbi:MAG: ABC transporter substrate-binding protein [Acidimicrobiia bacterium]
MQHRHRTPRIGSLLAVALSGALILAACGSDGDDSASPATDDQTSSAESVPSASPQAPPAPDAPAGAPVAAPAPEATPAPAPAPEDTPAKSAAQADKPSPVPSSAKAGAKASTPAKRSNAPAPEPAVAGPAPKPRAAPAPAPKPEATPEPAPAGGATDIGVTSDEIKVGSINMHGLPLGDILIDPQVRGMQASVRAINDSGGIHGRKIKFINCDDGPGDTARAKACMKKLAEQDKIFAMLTSTTWSSAAIHDDLEKYKLPLVGGWAYSNTEWEDPWMFPTHMPMIHEAHAAAEWVRDIIKPKTFGLICLTSPEMQQACQNVEDVLTDAGIEKVHQVDAGLNPPDMSADVVAMRAKNPDHIVHYVINPATIAKFVVEAAQQQYWPAKGVSGNHLAAEVLGQLFGEWPVDRYWTNTTYKLWGPEFIAVMDKYAPKNHGLNHHIVQAGFVGTNIFAEAAKKVGPNLTRTRLMEVLNSQVWDSGPGLDQKFAWSPDARAGKGPDAHGARNEYMYKYTDADTSSNRDGSPQGFVPDPDRFEISDTVD